MAPGKEISSCFSGELLIDLKGKGKSVPSYAKCFFPHSPCDASLARDCAFKQMPADQDVCADDVPFEAMG
jgi:hypothetical protein